MMRIHAGPDPDSDPQHCPIYLSLCLYLKSTEARMCVSGGGAEQPGDEAAADDLPIYLSQEAVASSLVMKLQLMISLSIYLRRRWRAAW
jgi:hypothetical protein